MDAVFGGALAVVIAGALALTVYYGFMGGDTKAGEEADPEFHFECQKCGHIVDRPREEFGPGVARVLDCPECGAKRSCLMMTECPNCHELYVSDRTKYQDRLIKGEKIEDICPHCGTNRVEFLDKKYGVKR